MRTRSEWNVGVGVEHAYRWRSSDDVYDVLPAGRPVNVKGPWPKGWRTMAQRKNETAQEFAARCEKAIEVERVCAPRPKSA